MGVQANKDEIFTSLCQNLQFTCICLLTILSPRGYCKKVSFRALGAERSMLCSSARAAALQANALLSGTEAEVLEHGESESLAGFVSLHLWTKCTEQHAWQLQCTSFSILRRLKWGLRAQRSLRSPKHCQWEAHPFGFCTHPLRNGKGNSATCMCFHHAPWFSVPLCHIVLEQGEETHVCSQITTRDSSSPSILFLENLEISERLNALSKHLPLTRNKYSPFSVWSSQNQQHLPPLYTNLLGFQPFYEHFQQIYGSSYSQLHYMNSSNTSIKNPALPPPFT